MQAKKDQVKKDVRKPTMIRVSDAEKRYARALSARNGCRHEGGDVAHGVKVALRRTAAAEGIPADVLGPIYVYTAPCQ
jgi:hypothetical protein